MIYILDTEISNKKSIFFSLRKVYGLGLFQTKFVCKQLGLSPNLKTSNLSVEQINKLIKYIENSDLKITSELKKVQSLILKNLINIKSYRGLRRLKGLPVRGQRTHTNSRTSRKIK